MPAPISSTPRSRPRGRSCPEGTYDPVRLPNNSLVCSSFVNGGLPYGYVGWVEGTPWGQKARAFRDNFFNYLPIIEGEEAQHRTAAATFATGADALIAWSQSYADTPDSGIKTFDAGTLADIGWRVVHADGGASPAGQLLIAGNQGAPSVAVVGTRAMIAYPDVESRGSARRSPRPASRSSIWRPPARRRRRSRSQTPPI